MESPARRERRFGLGGMSPGRHFQGGKKAQDSATQGSDIPVTVDSTGIQFVSTEEKDEGQHHVHFKPLSSTSSLALDAKVCRTATEDFSPFQEVNPFGEVAVAAFMKGSDMLNMPNEFPHMVPESNQPNFRRRPKTNHRKEKDLVDFDDIFDMGLHTRLVEQYANRHRGFVRDADRWLHEHRMQAEREKDDQAVSDTESIPDEENDTYKMDYEITSCSTATSVSLPQISHMPAARTVSLGSESERGVHGPASSTASKASAWRSGSHSSSTLDQRHTAASMFGLDHIQQNLHNLQQQLQPLQQNLEKNLPKVFTHGFTKKLSTNRHSTTRSGDVDAADVEEARLQAVIKIQRYFRRNRKRITYRNRRKRIRCSMGHRLEHIYRAQGLNHMDKDAKSEICERCYRTIRCGDGRDDVWYECRKCEYFACKDCINRMIIRNLSVGAKEEAQTVYMRQGRSMYWFKFCMGLLLLFFACFYSNRLVQDERSFSESVQSSSFGLKTVALFIIHLCLLVGDRIWHKLYYRCLSSSAGTRSKLDWIYLFLHIALFTTVHAFIMSSLESKANTRDVAIPLRFNATLCAYYVFWIFYFAACMHQYRLGLPALDVDLLRPTTDPQQQGYLMEKIRYFYYCIHYALPFVEDLRIIIDWTVVRTSLDLWMYWKVEDAHSFLFRTRHMMFTRRQSFFAEERDWVEKLFNGWLLVILIVAVILMPIIVFSPITPFPRSMPVSWASVKLTATFATSCEDLVDRACDTVTVNLFEADAQHYYEWTDGSAMSRWYFNANPAAPTDVDLQEVSWGPHSSSVFDVSPPVAWKVGERLRAGTAATPSMIRIKLSFSMLQKGYVSQTLYTELCTTSTPNVPKSTTWPVGLATCGYDKNMFQDVADWWSKYAFSGGVHDSVVLPIRLPNIWMPSVKLWRSREPEILKRATVSEDRNLQPRFTVNFTMANSRLLCDAGNTSDAQLPASWCQSDEQWGMFTPSGNKTLRILFELEKGAQISSDTTSSFGSVMGLYVGLVFVVGRYIRTAFQDSSKRAVYEEIPDVGVFLDLCTAIQLAREHGDLRTEFQLYYELMKVLRSTDLLLTTGGHEPTDYGVFRVDQCPAECIEPTQWCDEELTPTTGGSLGSPASRLARSAGSRPVRL